LRNGDGVEINNAEEESGGGGTGLGELDPGEQGPEVVS